MMSDFRRGCSWGSKKTPKIGMILQGNNHLCKYLLGVLMYVPECLVLLCDQNSFGRSKMVLV